MAPIEFAWSNPYYHVMGMGQELYVATDPDFRSVVTHRGDWCLPYELCPQGAVIDPLPPGLYYWKVHLRAWDWNPDSDVWSFTSATPPAPPPPPPPPPSPASKPTCQVPAVRGKTLAQAKRVIRARRCRLGGVRYGWSSVRKGRVIRQVPRAGRTLRAGAKIALVVSKGQR